MSGARAAAHDAPGMPPDHRRDAVIATPFGPFRLAVDDAGRLVRADFVDGADEGLEDGGGAAGAVAGAAALDAADGRRAIDDAAAAALARAVAQLTAYFAGTPTDFDLPVAPDGTAFERRVWAQLQTIPYGRTTSYGAVAAAIGEPPDAARAVGAANARNPIAVVIPCHRVIGADGALVGYAAGLARKRGLLALEQGQATLGW